MRYPVLQVLITATIAMSLAACQLVENSVHNQEEAGMKEGLLQDVSESSENQNEDGAREVTRGNEEKDERKVSQVKVPDWSKNAVIYEVNIRQYTKEGTFEAFREHLPRLKELGVDILWFMPIHPISQERRKGVLGSYYSVRDYKDVNPEFGTLEEFKQIVDECHEMGFKVILDWVANHTGWDNPWIKEHPDWYVRNLKGKIIHPLGTDWTDVAQLNYDNQDMRKAMIEAMKFWVEEIGVDGFRADYAGGVPVDFWEAARDELDRIKEVFMLAEDNRVMALLDKAFNANYGWELYNIMNNIAKGTNIAKHVEVYLKKIDSIYPRGTYPMHFTSNHDENSWNGTEYERLGDAVKTMAVLTFTVPGIPLIYSGQEAGLNKRLKFFEKDEIDWSDLSMQEFYKKLIELKKKNPALWNGDAGGEVNIFETTSNNVLAFERVKDGNRVIVIMNLSKEACAVEIKIGNSAGEYQQFFTGQNFNLSPQQKLELEPWEYIVLVSQ